MQLALANPVPSTGCVCRRPLVVAAAALVCAFLSGCAALSNPVEDAVPVNQLPPEVLGQRKEEERTIALPLLRQKPHDAYRLAPGDILGVWIETVLGDKGQPPPLLQQVAGEQSGPNKPAFGYPITVRDNGTVRLPLIDPLKVEGMTLDEAEAAIIKAYTVTRKIIQPGRERVSVTLMRPRTYHVLVVRQDTGAISISPTIGVGQAGSIGQTKRGTGYVVDLPAYENDVLNALARTGGLPGLDAENEVVIERGTYADFANPQAIRQQLEHLAPKAHLGGEGRKLVRIPLRLRPDQPPPFRPEDVVLQDGDIVFIEARDTEVFYVGGLLPSRQLPLPRDYDLDVVQAISFANGALVNGGLNGSNLSGALIQSGIGFPSPSLVTVLRKTAGGGQIPIRVDLDRALRDPRERLLVQAGDLLMLQETPAEAVTRYITNVLRLDFTGTFIRQRDLLGVGTATVP